MINTNLQTPPPVLSQLVMIPTPGRIQRDLGLPPPRYVTASHYNHMPMAQADSAACKTNKKSINTIGFNSDWTGTVESNVIKYDDGSYTLKDKTIITSSSSSGGGGGGGGSNSKNKITNTLKKDGIGKYTKDQLWVWLLLAGLVIALTPTNSRENGNVKNKNGQPIFTVARANGSSRLSQLLNLSSQTSDQLVLQYISTMIECQQKKKKKNEQ